MNAQIPAKDSAPPSVPDWGRLSYLTVGLLGSVLCGIAIVHVPPALAFGAVSGVLFILSVLVRPFWGLLIYTCLFLLRPGELYPSLAPLHLERVVGSLALLGMFFAQIRDQKMIALDKTLQTRLLLLFIAAVFVSVSTAVWQSRAINEAIEMAKVLAFYLLIVHLVTNVKRLKLFVWIFLGLIVYIGASSFWNYQHGFVEFRQGIDRAVGSTDAGGDPNHLGTTMAATIPLLLLLMMQKYRRPVRLVLLLATLVLAATMFVTGSRASLLGFLVGMSVLWWMSRRRVFWGVIGLLAISASFAVLPGQYKGRYGSIVDSEIDGSSQGRIDAWKAGLEMIVQRPVLGVGIGCFAISYANNRGIYLESHSLYVQVPSETGLLGAVPFFSFIAVTLRRNRKISKSLTSAHIADGFTPAILKGVFCGICVLLISGIFGHSMQRETWYVYAALTTVAYRLQNEHAASPLGAVLDSGRT